MVRLIGTQFSDAMTGSAFSDEIYGLGGNDAVRATSGNDYIDGSTGFDTADYTTLNRSITLLPRGVIDKNGFGRDQLVRVERIIAPIGQKNVINSSSVGGATSLFANLGTNSLVARNVPSVGTISVTVQNFVDVIGTNNSDDITGNSATNIILGLGGRDTLAGAAGSDGLSGGSGNDVLIGNAGVDVLSGDSGIDVLLGTDSRARGAGELDRLTGGADADGFIVGDRNGSYYKFAGNTDRAQITDLSSRDLIQVGTGETYGTQRTSQGFNLFVWTGRNFDFVAEVQTASFIALPTGNFRLASGQSLGNFFAA